MIAIQINNKTHHIPGNPADAAALQSLIAGADADGDDLHRGRSPANVQGGASVCLDASGGLYGPASVPADLLEFVRHHSVREVARALGMSRRTAHRLQGGYWPRDVRGIMACWDDYKGRSAQQTSGWFLRRVHPGGLVRHAGSAWSANGLAVRAGQQLAVARAVGGVLLAQTLELPPQRLQLTPVADMQGGAT